MNNIISANDGAFSLGLKFRVSKNRCEGCFKEIALASPPLPALDHGAFDDNDIASGRGSPHVDVKSRAVMPENAVPEYEAGE